MINIEYKISVIIPVLNEGNNINRIIDRVKSISGNALHEIIVVDGDAGGSTISKIEDKYVTKLVSEKGRARQMNAGARIASGDCLLFLHADTILPQGAFTEIERVMQSGQFVAGAFDLGISGSFVFTIIAWAASVKHRITRVPFGDQAIFIMRDYFEKTGGYKDIPLMEDVEIIKRIKKNGDRIVIIPLKVYTSARKWEKEGIAYTVIRNWMLQILYLFGVSPDRLVKYYYK